MEANMADEERESPRDRQSSVPMAVYVVIALLAVVVVALLITRPAADSTDVADPTTEATEAGAQTTTEAQRLIAVTLRWSNRPAGVL